MLHFVILQQDVWGAGGFKYNLLRLCEEENRLVLYCIGVLIVLMRLLQDCGKTIYSITSVVAVQPLCFLCQRHRRHPRTIFFFFFFLQMKIRMDTWWCSSYWTLSFFSLFTDDFSIDGNVCIASGVPSLMNPVTKPATTAAFNASVAEIPRKRKGSDSDNQ